MKRNCIHCGKNLGFFSIKHKLQDSIICSACYKKMFANGMKDFKEKLEFSTYKTFENTLKTKCEMCLRFQTEESLGNTLLIDHTNRMFVINGVILNFDNLVSFDINLEYEQVEQSTSTTKNKKGLGKALMGGLLFGGVGAIVGGLTANSKSKTNAVSRSGTTCTSVRVALTLKNYYKSSYTATVIPDLSELKQAHMYDIEDFGKTLKAMFVKILKNN